MFKYLIFGITYAFACAVQPGPFQTFLMAQALERGWKRTLPAALAPLLSDGPIILIAVVLLRSMPPWLEPLLFFTGGLFLIYLAFLSYRNWQSSPSSEKVTEPPHADTLTKAAMVNLLNPNPWLGWTLVMGPLLVSGWRESPFNGIVLLAAFYLTMVITTAILIVAFAGAGRIGPRINRILLFIATLGLAAFGVYALIRGILTFF
ncbi:MAG: LysE family transporter [Acidobacteria bacterium]|nr:LysE family transporter [Acidobacteriota bacterium]